MYWAFLLTVSHALEMSKMSKCAGCSGVEALVCSLDVLPSSETQWWEVQPAEGLKPTLLPPQWTAKMWPNFHSAHSLLQNNIYGCLGVCTSDAISHDPLWCESSPLSIWYLNFSCYQIVIRYFGRKVHPDENTLDTETNLTNPIIPSDR